LSACYRFSDLCDHLRDLRASAFRLNLEKKIETTDFRIPRIFKELCILENSPAGLASVQLKHTNLFRKSVQSVVKTAVISGSIFPFNLETLPQVLRQDGDELRFPLSKILPIRHFLASPLQKAGKITHRELFIARRSISMDVPDQE